MESDVRKDYILATVANYFRLAADDAAVRDLVNNAQLNTFLDDGNALLLAGHVEHLEDNAGIKIHLEHKPRVGIVENKILIFFKSRPDVVTPENMQQVILVSTMLDSPVAALYHALQKIYSPLLLQDSKWSGEFDPKLQDPSGRLPDQEAGDAIDALASILTPADETQYWADVANSDKKRENRDKAAAFWNTLEPVAKDFQSLTQMHLQDAEDVLETCQNALDDLWKLDDWVYPQKRMIHLMDIIANALTRFIQSQCTSLDLWKSPYSHVEEALTQGINLCEKWIDICQKLTSLYWKTFPPHLWEGGPYTPAQAVNFQRRLREVHSLRTLHKQLTQLLSNAEQEELKTSQSFEPFQDINPMQYNPYTEPVWQAAITSYENALVPAENRIAGKLKAQLRNMNANTLQFLQEFKRYQELIRRPSIQRELIVEREKLLGKLSEYIGQERKSFRDVGEVRAIHGVPPTINSIYFIKQLDAKIKDIMKTGELLLSDLNSWPQLKQEAEEAIAEMAEYQKELYDHWTRENLEDIESKSLSLLTSSQVVYFEQGRDMKVSYNPRLVGLTSETRLLQMLGFPVPKKIVDVAEQAKKFAQQAKLLEQIANFHNTIGDRMITSQRPMMLEAAFGLASLVKQQTNMTWEHMAQVEAYIAKLQQHVYKLARQNNTLALRHKAVKEKLLDLMNTDLLRKQQKWKDNLKEIRLIMTDVEQDGFTNLTTWRRHWDYQLYKALEHQYQVGLEALNEHLPEIKVELVYRQQALQFRPPIEEIRMKYFVQLKRFLAIPNNFKGVGESGSEASVFPTIIERNAHRFSHLFKKAEELFARLDKVKDKFVDWVALGSIDIEDYIKENLDKPEDWEANFRASKRKGQEIGRLPSGEEKIDCVSVSYAPIRNEIEILNRKYWDTLVNLLQRSIVHDIEEIERFATEAMDTLRKQPQTVEEIGEANQRHNEYNEQTPKMLERFHKADSKNKVLGQWTKEHMDAVNRVTGLWDNYMSLMENHEMVISKQVEAIKANLDTQVNNANGEIEKFKMRWDQLKPKEDSMEGDSSKILTGIAIIKEKRAEWQTLAETKAKIESDCTHFGLKEPDFPLFAEIEADLAKYEEMWGLFEEFNRSLKDMAKEEWIIFRSKSFKFEEFLTQWFQKLHSVTKATTVTVKLMQEIEKYKVVLPTLKYVRGDIFSEQHWNEMFSILSMARKPVDKLLFEDFLMARDRLVAHENELKELNNRAVGEVAIRQALSELDVWEVEAKFSFVDHEASSGEKVPLIKDWKDILNKVGDNQVLLQSIKGSPYYQSFGDRAVMWEQKLTDLDDILNNLNTAQRKWVYLEPYQEQMKLKSAKQTGGFDYREVFRKIDDDFRMIMNDARRDNRVVSLLRIGSIKSILEHMLERLERCQKSLNEFLEEKRSSFPRFYFIGDDDLLQILGQATKPAIIQTHLKKLFAGIYNVNFDPEEKHIVTMNSIDGEIVPLKNKVRISSEVEAWLNELAKEMKHTLKTLLTDCLFEGRRSNNGVDPLKYPSQVLCLAEAILFTERCEDALSAGRLEHYLSDLESQLDSYTSVDLSDDSGGDTKVLELKLKSLIFDIIHHIDIVKTLERENCKSKDDWLWQKQLRYYLNQEGFAYIAMVDASFEYTYEYQGNAQRMVHTPLIDKCFLTLTQGMRVGLGGNPYGPAGTGKTESVKALGGLFGRQVLVFNCDEGIDVKSMGRIFIGLIKCGAWGCFDEFNRLEEQTLSAVSMQIQPIQTALRNKDRAVSLLEKEVDVDHNAGIFVTMNPAGKGYGGRQKLPDNLKQLFRPVAMSRPDSELIAEVLLYSEGFKNARDLGYKLVNLFSLSKSLLTPQQHYDWNLRALKTVLRGCGNMLKLARRETSKELIDAARESEIVVQALRLNTLSKLTFSDSMRFDSLIRDVFPGVAFNNAGYEELKVALRESCVELGLNVNESQVKKAIELFEQLQQRMGVVIVGPSGSGKTTLFKILKHALVKLGHTVKQHTMNPKAIPRHQLLGSIDLDTREWTNGVLTVAALQAVDEPASVSTWVVCDGDIDPEWVESLNSVLDDNRLLTLPSGWRIQFGPNVNFIFETHDLTYASPATISRMGMIFLSDEDTDVKGLVSSWLKTQPDPVQEVLPRYIEEYFFKAIDWCQKAGDFVVETSLVGCVLNGLAHMNGVTSRLEFAVALVKGLGGNLREGSRDAFAKEVYKWVGESPPGRKPTATFYNRERDRIDAFSSDVEGRLALDDFGGEHSPLIETSDVKAALASVMNWLQPDTQQPFLLIGPEGCGKSLILHHCFKKLRSTNVATVHCSSHISPQHVIQKLSQVCLMVSSSNGRVLRPKECDRLVLYLKDLNLASPDKYGTCMLIAFLQQILTYGGFYDNNLEWVGLEAVQVVGSITAGTGLGRHTLTARFTSIVRLYSLVQPDKEHMEVVYSSYLGAALRHVLPNHSTWSNESKVSQLAASMVKIYHELRQIYSVDDNSHYLFTPRDITEWTLGLVRYDIDPEDKSPNALLEVWAYEACRMFRDKLVSEDDENKFDSILRGTLQTDWSSSAADKLGRAFFVTAGEGSIAPGAPMPKFGRALGRLGVVEWEQTVEQGATLFSRENRDLGTVITPELLSLVSSCDRVLSSPGGSLLLIGRCGAGRRMAASITSALHHATLNTLKMGKNYGPKQFKAELKASMQVAGVDGEQVFLMLEDHNFGDPRYLDMVNSLLSSGEVPGLYSTEELEPLMITLREKANNEGFSGDLFSFFAKCVKKNLHVVLVMDYAHPNFIQNCESNPALYKKCQVIWIDQWSPETMVKLPLLILNKPKDASEGGQLGGDKEQGRRRLSGGEDLPQQFYRIHASLPAQDASPHKYVDFIHTYDKVYGREKEEISSRQSKLSRGVSKLKEAREVVKTLKKEAALQEKELAEKQNEANQALSMITETMKNANLQKDEMETLKTQTLKEEKSIQERKKIIEAEMAEIGPLVEEAKKAVGNIKATTLAEIRALRAPPEVIRDILEGVLRLMGTKDASWNSMKSFLAKRGVKDEILQFDARKIHPKDRQIVEKLLEDRSNSFDPDVAKRASGAAAPLASWVLANVKFSYVLEKVKPLEAEQSKLQANLQLAEEQLTGLSTGLDEVDKKVAVLKERLNKFTKEAAAVEIHLAKTKETIAAADSLVVGLEGEYSRWNSEVQSMEDDLSQIPQFSLLGAAFLVYLSNAPEDRRRKYMELWQKSLGIAKFDLNHFLSSERQILQWRSEGLPSDNLSVENAICILQNMASPYLIDPSSRASDWLKHHLAHEAPQQQGRAASDANARAELEVTTQSDDRFVLTLELAIRFGKTLFVQDVNDIDPILYPVLRRDLVGQGPYKVVQVGDKQVDYNSNFRLFLSTRNAAPDIPPDAQAIISTVNFTTTRAGLTGQLLAAALQHEKPELEERKSELLKQEEENKIEISRLEDFLLEQLASSSGNILENKELLSSLNETKEKSASIAAALQESTRLAESLEAEGNAYLPLAEFASQMFFNISDLKKLNNMYRVSLSAFTRLYQDTLADSTHSAASGEKRIEALKHGLQTRVFHYISRSLFKADRLTFAMHFVHGMFPALFARGEWDAFLGLLVDAGDAGSGTAVPGWISEDTRQATLRLRSSFPELYSEIQLEETNVWLGFAQSEDCENNLPVQIVKRMSLFQQVLVVQALRPDRLVSAMELFVQKALQLKELAPPALSLKNVYRETVSTEPVIILITSGSDPSEELRELARAMSQQLHEVAMGQGQSEVAVAKLRSAAHGGQWLCLKNLHLMTYWIPVLEKELRELKPDPSFRLWLTAESHQKFSPILTELCLKVTYESPPGLKRNLQRTLMAWGGEVFEKKRQVVARSQTLFALAWFHAIVQERRTYIPQGWCKFYEFSDADLKAGLEVLEQLFNAGEMRWQFVHGLYENAIYGGRVDDANDIKILGTYLKQIFGPDTISGTAKANEPLGPFNIPGTTNFNDYFDLVNHMHEEDKPSLFGLPANIERSHQRMTSSATLSQLKLLMRSHVAGAKFEREKWNKELTPILNLWKKLNSGSELLQMKLHSPTSADNDPMLAFIELEFFNAVTLLQTIHKALSGLSKVIRGTALLDDKVSKLADSLLGQETPEKWQKLWSGPEDPMDYLHVTVTKASEVQKWKSMGESVLRSELALTDLFHPDTFLGALRQVTARSYGVAMDELHLVNTWDRTPIQNAQLVIRVEGIMIEGAIFDGKALKTSKHDSPTHSLVPTCNLSWVPHKGSAKPGADAYDESTHIRVPLYYSSEREAIVAYLDLPSGGDKKTWLQAGVVLFINSML